MSQARFGTLSKTYLDLVYGSVVFLKLVKLGGKFEICEKQKYKIVKFTLWCFRADKNTLALFDRFFFGPIFFRAAFFSDTSLPGVAIRLILNYWQIWEFKILLVCPDVSLSKERLN